MKGEGAKNRKSEQGTNGKEEEKRHTTAKIIGRGRGSKTVPSEWHSGAIGKKFMSAPWKQQDGREKERVLSPNGQ